MLSGTPKIGSLGFIPHLSSSEVVEIISKTGEPFYRAFGKSQPFPPNTLYEGVSADVFSIGDGGQFLTAYLAMREIVSKNYSTALFEDNYYTPPIYRNGEPFIPEMYHRSNQKSTLVSWWAGWMLSLYGGEGDNLVTMVDMAGSGLANEPRWENDGGGEYLHVLDMGMIFSHVDDHDLSLAVLAGKRCFYKDGLKITRMG